MDKAHIDRIGDEPEGPVVTNRALFIGYVLAVALFALLWVALYASAPFEPQMSEIQSCLAQENAAARLMCYDAIAHRAPASPAKGALVPLTR